MFLTDPIQAGYVKKKKKKNNRKTASLTTIHYESFITRGGGKKGSKNAQKNLSSILKWGLVTSSGLRNTEMDFHGFSVTSCCSFLARRSSGWLGSPPSDCGEGMLVVLPRLWSSSVSRVAALTCSMAVRRCSAGSERTEESFRAWSMTVSSDRCSSMLH